MLSSYYILAKLCIELAGLGSVANVLSLCDFRLVLIKLFADQFSRGAGAVVSALLFA